MVEHAREGRLDIDLRQGDFRLPHGRARRVQARLSLQHLGRRAEALLHQFGVLLLLEFRRFRRGPRLIQ